MDDEMCYVAADPAQPGAAWAICTDEPEYAKEIAKSISVWVREGAQIMRVTRDAGVEMMMKWERPATKTKAAKPGSLL